MQKGEIGLRVGEALRGGLGVPLGGARVVALDAEAVVVHHGEIELVLRGALFGGAHIPGECRRMVLRDTQPRAVESAERVLRGRIALLGGAAIPMRRCRKVKRRTEAAPEEVRELGLRQAVALLGLRPQQPNGGGVIAAIERRAYVLRQVGACAGRERQHGGDQRKSDDAVAHAVSGRRYFAARRRSVHSRARRCASATCSAVISLANTSRDLIASASPSAAARFTHLWACT
jgi:hypothetical protein